MAGALLHAMRSRNCVSQFAEIDVFAIATSGGNQDYKTYTFI